jgi:hypothetical protein
MSSAGRVRVLRLAVALALLLLVACGAEDPADAPGEGPEDEAPADPPTDDVEAEMELTGTFTGDPELEGGCAWVETGDGTRYEVLWPDGYEVRWEPLELLGPGGETVAADGDAVRVRGAPAEDMVSICMVGQLVSAETVDTP